MIATTTAAPDTWYRDELRRALARRVSVIRAWLALTVGMLAGAAYGLWCFTQDPETVVLRACFAAALVTLTASTIVALAARAQLVRDVRDFRARGLDAALPATARSRVPALATTLLTLLLIALNIAFVDSVASLSATRRDIDAAERIRGAFPMLGATVTPADCELARKLRRALYRPPRAPFGVMLQAQAVKSDYLNGCTSLSAAIVDLERLRAAFERRVLAQPLMARWIADRTGQTDELRSALGLSDLERCVGGQSRNQRAIELCLASRPAADGGAERK
jgi:hypothetical protein